MTTAAVDRSFNGNHTFTCALTTRGGECDCWPTHKRSANAGPAHWSPASVTEEPTESRGRLPHPGP
jgi:hypothetical protein